MTPRMPGIVIAVACSVSGTAEGNNNLKPLSEARSARSRSGFSGFG